jgi:hypothetical protein
MAVRSVTATKLQGNTVVMLYAWTGLATGDTGEPIEPLDWGDLTVTIEGDFGTGVTGSLEGSNDGTNYYALTDPQGNAISKTAAAVEAVTETPRYIRPKAASGTGGAIECRILARRGSR